jgi:sulfate permease, SulP family
VAVLLCLLFLTPFLYYVPMACLGGIIEASLVSLFEYKPFKKAYRISKPDFAVMCVTAATTAVVNIEVGLCVGIFVSIAVLLQELSEVRTSVMVPVQSANGRYLMRSQSVDPSGVESDYIKVIRLTASLFFGNQEELRNAFQALVLGGGSYIRAVVVDASGVSHLDFTGLEAIAFMHSACVRGRGGVCSSGA